jgi:hypothetical protein
LQVKVVTLAMALQVLTNDPIEMQQDLAELVRAFLTSNAHARFDVALRVDRME